MRLSQRIVVGLVGVVVLLATLGASAPADGKAPFTLDDYILNKFATRTFKGTWVADTVLRFYNSTTRDVILYDVVDTTTKIHVPGKILSDLKNSSIDSFSTDNRLVAIAYETVKLYRHSTTSKFIIYDTITKQTHKVHGDEQLRTLMWAGERSIIWVKDNNVYYRKDATSSGSDIPITSDGQQNIIFNGIPDWVYEEEVLASGSAMWPSPDGSKLAFASFDDTKVQHAFYFKYGADNGSTPQYPEVVNITYPKAGTPNPDVRLRVVDLEKTAQTGQVTLIDIPAPVGEVTKDHILYGCFWSGDRLLASWTNRVQNKNVIQSCDLSGSCRQALSLSESAGWVDPPTLLMHSKGNRAAAILPNEDRPHLAVITFPEGEGQEPHTVFLTTGSITVLSVLGWDEKAAFLYFEQTMPDDPAKKHVYRVKVPGEDNNQVAASTPQCLTCNLAYPGSSTACQYGGASLSKGFSYGALSCLGPDPAFYALYRLQQADAEPKLIRMWEDNADVRALLATRQRPEYWDGWVPVKEGFEARVRLLLPPGMDKTGSTKYPLLVYVYAGPDSNQVTWAFSMAFGDYLCTSRNIIYALIDGRGSGHNGRRQMHAVYRNLGTVEIEDQIDVANQLKSKFPYVDPTRTAIWGWSYGGFSTAHAMARDKEGVFCCGVSVAPVTSFIYYDTIYTERYMGLPKDDNEAGYNGTDVTRRVANFKHKKYLLIHGNADDNVHYQQSMELSRALETQDIMFQQQSYPDEAHALSGVKRHVYHTMDDFWTRAFRLPKPEWQNRAAR